MMAVDVRLYAEYPHVRFDEGEVASAATPRRGSLLYMAVAVVAVAFGAWAATDPVGG